MTTQYLTVARKPGTKRWEWYCCTFNKDHADRLRTHLEKGEMLVIGNVGDSVIKLKSGPLDAAVRQVQVEDTGNLDKLQKSLGFAGNGTILTLPGIEA